MSTKKAELYNSKILDKYFESIDASEAEKVEKKMRLAAKIEDAMIAQGHTKISFAEKMSKRPSVITKWLSGTHNFTIDTLFEIEKALHIELVRLVEQKNVTVMIFKTETSHSIDDSYSRAYKNNIVKDRFNQFYI